MYNFMLIKVNGVYQMSMSDKVGEEYERVVFNEFEDMSENDPQFNSRSQREILSSLLQRLTLKGKDKLLSKFTFGF